MTRNITAERAERADGETVSSAFSARSVVKKPVSAEQITSVSSSKGNQLVSLVVVTYNSEALLPSFFAALETTTYAPYEVIVVDNASSDGTLRYLAEAQPRARVLANAENLGFGRACNQGARAARGEIIIFLNPDVIVLPDWLSGLALHSSARPDAILCPTTLYPGEQPRPSATPVEEVAAVPGCALLVRRQAWQAIGEFDERFFLYWEDTELCWRAWLLGYWVLADLQSFVVHERGGSAGGRRWDAERVKNSLCTYLKLMRWRRVAPFALLLALKTLVKFARWRDPALLRAWSWNWRNLGHTLAQRRELTSARRGDVLALERRIAAQERHLARERRARRQVV